MLCCRAYRVVDETDQDFMGSKLVVSFANPAKHYDAHAVRPQSNFNSSLNSAAANKLVGQASPAGNMLAQRASLLAGKPGFGGRTTPGQAAGKNVMLTMYAKPKSAATSAAPCCTPFQAAHVQGKMSHPHSSLCTSWADMLVSCSALNKLFVSSSVCI